MPIDIPTVQMTMAKPAGSNAVLDIDPAVVIAARQAAILARPSLLFYGDASTFQVTGGKVTGWNSRVGANAYAQATAGKQPDHRTALGPNGKAWAEFSGTADTSGDLMMPNFAARAVNLPLTVVDILMTDTIASNRYMDGQAGTSPDAIVGQVVATGGGNIRQQWGNAIAERPMVAGQWKTVVRSYDGAGAVEIDTHGIKVTATATGFPTTPRLLTLGSISGGNATGLWDGGFAFRAVFTEFIGADRAFFRELGDFLALPELYALPENPVAAA
jgi:hypothetical protein